MEIDDLLFFFLIRVAYVILWMEFFSSCSVGTHVNMRSCMFIV